MRKTFREIAKKAAGGMLVLAMTVTSLGGAGGAGSYQEQKLCESL